MFDYVRSLEPYPAWDLLDEHGPSAMIRVVDTRNLSRELVSSPAARLLADPRDAAEMRSSLQQGELLDDRSWCDSHAISVEAAGALRLGDLDQFIRYRLSRLEELEHALLSDLGRPPGMFDVLGFEVG